MSIAPDAKQIDFTPEIINQAKSSSSVSSISTGGFSTVKGGSYEIPIVKGIKPPVQYRTSPLRQHLLCELSADFKIGSFSDKKTLHNAIYQMVDRWIQYYFAIYMKPEFVAHPLRLDQMYSPEYGEHFEGNFVKQFQPELAEVLLNEEKLALGRRATHFEGRKLGYRVECRLLMGETEIRDQMLLAFADELSVPIEIPVDIASWVGSRIPAYGGVSYNYRAKEQARVCWNREGMLIVRQMMFNVVYFKKQLIDIWRQMAINAFVVPDLGMNDASVQTVMTQRLELSSQISTTFSNFVRNLNAKRAVDTVMKMLTGLISGGTYLLEYVHGLEQKHITFFDCLIFKLFVPGRILSERTRRFVNVYLHNWFLLALNPQDQRERTLYIEAEDMEEKLSLRGTDRREEVITFITSWIDGVFTTDLSDELIYQIRHATEPEVTDTPESFADFYLSEERMMDFCTTRMNSTLPPPPASLPEVWKAFLVLAASYQPNFNLSQRVGRGLKSMVEQIAGYQSYPSYLRAMQDLLLVLTTYPLSVPTLKVNQGGVLDHVYEIVEEGGSTSLFYNLNWEAVRINPVNIQTHYDQIIGTGNLYRLCDKHVKFMIRNEILEPFGELNKLTNSEVIEFYSDGLESNPYFSMYMRSIAHLGYLAPTILNDLIGNRVYLRALLLMKDQIMEFHKSRLLGLFTSVGLTPDESNLYQDAVMAYTNALTSDEGYVHLRRNDIESRYVIGVQLDRRLYSKSIIYAPCRVEVVDLGGKTETNRSAQEYLRHVIDKHVGPDTKFYFRWNEFIALEEIMFDTPVREEIGITEYPLYFVGHTGDRLEAPLTRPEAVDTYYRWEYAELPTLVVNTLANRA